MKSLVALMTLSLLPMLFGCGASLPTENDAKKAFQEELTKQNQNRLTLLSFQKTNGLASAEGGVQEYKIEFQGEVEVAEDCAGWLSSLHTFVMPQDVVVDTTAFAARGQGKKTVIPRDHSDDLKKGKRQKISGKVEFEKAENGWRVTRLDGNGWGPWSR